MRGALRLLLTAAGITVAGLALAACHGGPHEFVVTTFADGPDAVPGDGVCEMTPSTGDCSLRAAVDEVGALPGASHVRLPSGTYVLTSTLEITSSDPVTLTGEDPGARIDADGAATAIDAQSGTVTFDGIGATGATGPGILVRDGATADLRSSAAFLNGGAGLSVESGGEATLLHSTVSTNSGGGVVGAGDLRALYATVTANSAGGLATTGGVEMAATVVADQSSGTDCAGAVTSADHNLDSDGSCGLGAADDLSGTPAMLGALSSDLVPSHLPDTTSPALDSASAAAGCGSDLAGSDQRRTPRPRGAACERGAVERPFFVAVTQRGVIAHSLDGSTWQRDVQGSSLLLDVTYGAAAGRWVAIGGGGLVTSTDAADWEIGTPIKDSSMYQVAESGGTWVATGSSGDIYTSTDGLAWTPRTSGTTKHLYGLADDGSGTWVAVGLDGTILTSPDTVAWTPRTSGTTESLVEVGFGDGTWVAVGANGTILTSPDAVTWTPRTSGVALYLNAVAHDGLGEWVAVGRDGTILTSPDAVTWTPRTSGTSSHLNAVAHDGVGQWIAVGNGGTVLTSPGATTWTAQGIGTLENVEAVSRAAGVWVITTDDVYTSADGSAWTQAFTSSFWNATAVGGDGTWMAVGYEGKLQRSENGVDWVPVPFADTVDLRDVAHNDRTDATAQWVAVGQAGEIYTSPDGVSWTARVSGVATGLYSVEHDDGLWVVVGASGVILTSPDGVTWTPRTSGVATFLDEVAHDGAGTWVVVGASGVILTSPDGVTWTPRTSGTAEILTALAHDGAGLWVVGGYRGAVLTSPDGVTWTPQTSGTSISLRSGAFGDGQWLLGGLASRTSTDAVTWNPVTIAPFQATHGVAHG